MQYLINDRVVHPYHGAGVITDICMKDISGVMVECVVIKLSGGRGENYYSTVLKNEP